MNSLKLVLSAAVASTAVLVFAALPAGTTTVAIGQTALVAETRVAAVALTGTRHHSHHHTSGEDVRHHSHHHTSETASRALAISDVVRPQPRVQL